MTCTQDSLKESIQYNCPKCKDTGLIVNGWDAVECSCNEQRKLNARMKNAMIPEEFENARFDNYKRDIPVRQVLYESMVSYLKVFEQIKDTSVNSIGFIAVFGEQKLREIKNKAMRAELKKKHNNFGLGKTHLQVAAAKWLIKRGYPVLMVSDVTLMADLSAAKAYSDEGEELNRILGAVIQAPVLVWDDIGKAKSTETRLDLYYEIINARYKARRPIIFSSNEDQETLTEKIGDAAASRLFGMSKDFLYAVEGPDYRLSGE